ncbi:MAG: tetratricopeptide repeat protein [Acidobacteriota bacterium]
MLRLAGVLTLALTFGHAPGARADANASDADRALAEGRFKDALALYGQTVATSPHDRHALREAGRAAHALQQFAVAVDFLERADALATAPDPELHYLLGEAYWTLGETELATAVQRKALAELGNAPTGRMERLWVAKIDARFGDRKSADAIYDTLARENPGDSEAVFAQTEMHAAAHEWEAADHVIRRYLARDPQNARGRALLAWTEEARGTIASEVATRASLANSRHADKDSVRDYGRALERSGDWSGARDAYARALELPGGTADHELAAAFERVDGKTSIEVGAGGVGRTDPMASSLGAYTGIAVPFGPANHITLHAWDDRTTAGNRSASAGEVLAAMTVRGRDDEAMLGVKAGMLSPAGGMATRPTAGAVASASTGLLLGHVKLAIDGELHSVWHETPVVELYGGNLDAITAHVYGVALDNRLVIDTGAQARILRLAAADSSGTDVSARQGLAWGGADYVIWRDFAHEAAGQLLDDSMLHATYAADSVVASYRHYELVDHSDDMFNSLLAIAPRASIDEVSATARKVLAHGRIAAEARGGLGHDWIRELAIAHGGASLWLAPTRSSRLALSFDIAKESVGTFVGVRRTGWVTYHVDL